MRTLLLLAGLLSTAFGCVDTNVHDEPIEEGETTGDETQSVTGTPDAD